MISIDFYTQTVVKITFRLKVIKFVILFFAGIDSGIREKSENKVKLREVNIFIRKPKNYID